MSDILLSRDFLDKVFNYVPAGKTYLNDDYDEFWWTSAHEEGYYMIWANGDTHHTYNKPDEIYP